MHVSGMMDPNAYIEAFGYQLAIESEGKTKFERWLVATKENIITGLLSYIPIVNLIAYSILIAQAQQKSNGQYLKSETGKALLGRTIVLSLGLIPIVMLLDTIATIMKCNRRPAPKNQDPQSVLLRRPPNLPQTNRGPVIPNFPYPNLPSNNIPPGHRRYGPPPSPIPPRRPRY